MGVRWFKQLRTNSCARMLVMAMTFASLPGLTHSVELKPFPTLTLDELTDLAHKIRFNETANRDEWLLFWSQHEAFPSLGIGHFIWLPANVDAPFEPAFPAMARFVAKFYATPEWILAEHAPWANRDAFYHDQQRGAEDIAELQAWLLNTQPWQMAFILSRFESRAKEAYARLNMRFDDPRWQIFEQLLSTSAGRYALIDYSNFKGWGDLASERYQEQGWGVFDAITLILSAEQPIDILDESALLDAFSSATYHLLTRRVNLAPRSETHWLAGWKKRTEGYRLEGHNESRD